MVPLSVKLFFISQLHTFCIYCFSPLVHTAMCLICVHTQIVLFEMRKIKKLKESVKCEKVWRSQTSIYYTRLLTAMLKVMQGQPYLIGQEIYRLSNQICYQSLAYLIIFIYTFDIFHCFIFILKCIIIYCHVLSTDTANGIHHMSLIRVLEV